jgi:hypothetical protein
MNSSDFPNDTLVEMTTEDFAVVYDKVKMWKVAPLIIRGFLALMTVLAVVFVIATGWDMIGTIMISVFFILAWGGMEWAIRTFTNRLKTDLLNREKRVVEGELEKCYQVHSKNRTGSSQGYWVIGGEKIAMDSAEYGLAAEGDWVYLEMLPASKVMIRVEVVGKGPDPFSA